MIHNSRIDRYKAALDAVRPFEGDSLRDIRDYYKIRLTWSSNALDGNALNLSETGIVLEDGLSVGGRPLRDIYETVGHGEAYDFIFSRISERAVCLSDIRAVHRLFYQKIDPAQAGVWRNRPVFDIDGGGSYPAPREIERKMRELGAWAGKGRGSLHPVAFAALLHLKLVAIYPFTGGNGHTGRLIMNLALLQDGYPLALIHPAYQATYRDAIRVYERQGDMEPFVDFIAGRVEESEEEMMRLLDIPFPADP